MKPIQLLLIIFCLGIFLIPKDNFYAQASQESCCKAESKKTCCEKKHDDHGSKDSKSDHKSCNDDCCSICVTCNTFLENTFAKNNIWEISSFKTILKIQVQYADPYISNGLKEIWQPPKLG